MKKEKKSKIAVILSVISGLLPMFALAGFNVSNVRQPQGATIANVPSWINAIVDLMWWVFVAGVIILFLFAGLTFLTAQGDPKKLEDARRYVLWGVVGVFVGVLGFSITALIAFWFGL